MENPENLCGFTKGIITIEIASRTSEKKYCKIH